MKEKKQKKGKRVVKKTGTVFLPGLVLVDKTYIDEISDPHAKRYVLAMRLFIEELMALFQRWGLSPLITNGRLSFNIRLPEDRDKGIFMPKQRRTRKKK